MSLLTFVHVEPIYTCLYEFISSYLALELGAICISKFDCVPAALSILKDIVN